MHAEVSPAGELCHLFCYYCYQGGMRDAGNFGGDGYDFEAIKRTMEHYGVSNLTLFGGEPLLAPMSRLVELFVYGHERSGGSNIQTNGELITEEHIKLFKQYRVTVGTSLDGPDELNDVRWNGTLEATRAATATIEANIARLCREGIRTSVIVTLHRLNGTGANFDRLREWIKGLAEVGITSMRLHILEADTQMVRRKYLLSNEEYLSAFLDLMRFEHELGRTLFDIPTDLRRMLLGEDDDVTCIWAGCDSYNTSAVFGIGPNGDRHNCGRTTKEGVNWQKSDTTYGARSLVLYNTPREYGGCRGCRFFLMCRGQCPGTAIDGDWRNRSEFCSVWRGLFTYVEMQLLGEGQHPLSLSPDRHDFGARADGERERALDGLRGEQGDGHGGA